jgi:hypothetical protein
MRQPPDILGEATRGSECYIGFCGPDGAEPAEYRVRLHDPGWDGLETNVCGTCLAIAQKAARQPDGQEDTFWESMEKRILTSRSQP